MGGDLDVAMMAQEKAFDERFDIRPLYRERFSVALPPGHRLAAKNAVRVTDLAGESYLQRLNCEYYDTLNALADDWGKLNVKTVYQSEREDWIQTMVMAGMGICFMPEFSQTMQGLVTRPLVDPEVTREVSLVSIAGRRFSPAVGTFVKAIKAYKWLER